MKVAIFSDVHGNIDALEAVLDDIDKHHVDLIVCAGDAINPFPGSAQIWQEIQQRQIPMVMGNHEEYVLAMCDPTDPLEIHNRIEFLPVKHTVEQLSHNCIADIANLPKTLTISGPDGDDILVCHASPHSTRHSFAQSIDETMGKNLSAQPERVIVGGHLHWTWHRQWQDKMLLLCGSAGFGLNSTCEAEYLILTHHHGTWNAEHRAISYDHATAMQRVRNSGFLSNGGPIAWLFFDELRTAERRLVPFHDWLGSNKKPTTKATWQSAIQSYLEAIGSWPYLVCLAAG